MFRPKSILVVSVLIVLISFGCKKEDTPVTPPVVPDPQTVTDIDGNVYTTVRIGTQLWMTENLKVTKYNDGTPIPLVPDSAAWDKLRTHGYCWCNNDAASYKNVYGGLYNWYAVNTGKLAPKGWHVPSDSEWTILSTYLGGDSIAGGKMKEAGHAHWGFPNFPADNSSGFTGLPAGVRHINGIFGYMGIYGAWWTTNGDAQADAFSIVLVFYEAKMSRHMSKPNNGLSVRCVKD